MPSPDELDAHYSQYPYLSECPDLTLHRYRQILASFEEYRKNNNLLEIGCGAGYFLEEAKKLQWNVSGTEKGEQIIKKLTERGLLIHNNLFDSSSFANGSYDVIVMIEVIEHLTNPLDFIQRINELLRPGGVLYLTTPNFNCIERKVLKDKYRIISYPEHLWYFTPKSTHRILSENNFSKKFIKTHGLSISELKRKKNESTNQNCGFDQNLRLKAERNKTSRFLIDFVNFFLNIFKHGNTIKAFYLKTKG